MHDYICAPQVKASQNNLHENRIVAGALFEMLNRKASELRMEREKLLIEQRQLQESLAPLQSGLTAEIFRSQLIL